MKGLTFTTIAFVLIALVAVIIFLGVFQSVLPGFLGKPFCKVYQAILALPIPSQLKPNVAGCSIIPSTQYINLKSISSFTFTKDYVENCWKTAEEGKKGQTFICYEIFVKNVETSITERDVNDVLKEEGRCDILPNNRLDVDDEVYDCGDKNSIYWNIGEISGRDTTVIIKYNAFAHRLEVK